MLRRRWSWWLVPSLESAEGTDRTECRRSSFVVEDNKLSVTTSTPDSSTLIFDALRWKKGDLWKNRFYLGFGENVNDWPFG